VRDRRGNVRDFHPSDRVWAYEFINPKGTPKFVYAAHRFGLDTAVWVYALALLLIDYRVKLIAHRILGLQQPALMTRR
jgi:hypothetical protein